MKTQVASRAQMLYLGFTVAGWATRCWLWQGLGRRTSWSMMLCLSSRSTMLAWSLICRRWVLDDVARINGITSLTSRWWQQQCPAWPML